VAWGCADDDGGGFLFIAFSELRVGGIVKVGIGGVVAVGTGDWEGGDEACGGLGRGAVTVCVAAFGGGGVETSSLVLCLRLALAVMNLRMAAEAAEV
jgi:hypothetical protein